MELPTDAFLGYGASEAGAALAPVGDFEGEGVDDLAVGAPGGGADSAGAVHIVPLTPG